MLTCRTATKGMARRDLSGWVASVDATLLNSMQGMNTLKATCYTCKTHEDCCLLPSAHACAAIEQIKQGRQTNWLLHNPHANNNRAMVESGADLAEHRCCLVGDAARVQQPAHKAAEHENIE